MMNWPRTLPFASEMLASVGTIRYEYEEMGYAQRSGPQAWVGDVVGDPVGAALPDRALQAPRLTVGPERGVRLGRLVTRAQEAPPRGSVGGSDVCGELGRGARAVRSDQNLDRDVRQWLPIIRLDPVIRPARDLTGEDPGDRRRREAQVTDLLAGGILEVVHHGGPARDVRQVREGPLDRWIRGDLERDLGGSEVDRAGGEELPTRRRSDTLIVHLE